MRIAVAFVVGIGACCPAPEASDMGAYGERWDDADVLFHQDPRWLGGDGAYTIDLGDDHTLWLFGDSFIATSPVLTRTESTMVRNSIAIMSGRDPLTATMQFAWRDGASPSSFFPEDGADWFWPADGVRAPDGSLLVFLSEVRATPGEGLGFEGVGWRAVRIADPSGDPSTWLLAPVISHPPAFAPTASIACSTTDGDNLIAVVTDGDAHDGRLALWSLADVELGDLSAPAWWDGKRWVAEADLESAPAVVFPSGSTECSLAPDGYGGWIYVQSRGFGASTLAMRRALTVTGPYVGPSDMLTPPESKVPEAFVYAGKAHASLIPAQRHDGSDVYTYDLVVTFADNSFTFADLLDPARAQTLYWPHFVRVQFSWAAC